MGTPGTCSGALWQVLAFIKEDWFILKIFKLSWPGESRQLTDMHFKEFTDKIEDSSRVLIYSLLRVFTRKIVSVVQTPIIYTLPY